MATTMVNGSSGAQSAESNPPSIAMPNAGKQQAKPAATGSKADQSRKSSNPAEGNQRRSAPQKAWSGMNPITQRSVTPAHQNGAIPQSKAGPKINSDAGNNKEKMAHERLLYLLGNMMGQNASVTVKNGDVYSGIFFGASMEAQEHAFVLKMVQHAKSAERGELNGAREGPDGFVGFGDDHTMSFDTKDVVDLVVEGAVINMQDKRPNGASSGFRTDTDISGNVARRDRDLQPWTAPNTNDVDMSLESSASTGGWDQFQANEKLFGVKSDYDENIYTTRIDRSNPQFRQREAEAERIAREIESHPTNNAHLREERGLADEDGEYDEEERYSGVRRLTADYPPLQSSQPNRYMPPARRAPTGKPTVPGAPVDPAIISSQIARVDTSPQQPKEDKPAQPAQPVPSIAPAESNVKAAADLSKENAKEGSVAKAVPVSSARPSEAPKASVPNAVANRGVEVLGPFKQFAEKQKMRVADDKRQRVSHDKAIKLNDLKAFSKNFSLHTPVPKDLVPILSKDKKKQDEIMEKSQRSAEQQNASPGKAAGRSGDQAPSRPVAELKRDAGRGSGGGDRQDYGRQGVPPRGPQANLPFRERPPYPLSMPPPADQSLFANRLAKTQRDRQAGVPVAIPTPLPIQAAQKSTTRATANAPRIPSSQTSSTVRTPTSSASTKFNVQANAFIPNPAANTFTPTGQPSASPSPKGITNAKTTSRASSPSHFFGGKKPLPLSERPLIQEHFNPLRRLKEKAENEGKSKDYAPNGGIVFAYTTPVTWSVVKDDEEVKSYKDMFEAVQTPAGSGISPQPSAASPINPNLAHLHQLPPHLQQGSPGMPHMPTPQPSYQGPPTQHLYPGVPHHYEDHRMHTPSASSPYSNPRVPGGYVPYPAPMGQAVPGGIQYAPAMGQGQPMHPHTMGPGAPQPPHFRQMPNAPQYMHSPGQQLAAPMMVQQNSQGPYMGPQVGPVPHMPMYATGPAPTYGPSQPPSGYPSPSRGPPMMMHQGSYQGQTPQMHAGNGQPYVQPFYAQQPPPHMAQMRGYPSPQPQYSQSPHQQYHYPPQPTRVPSHGYVQHHPQGPTHQMPVQQHPSQGAPMEGGEGMK